MVSEPDCQGAVTRNHWNVLKKELPYPEPIPTGPGLHFGHSFSHRGASGYIVAS